HDVFYISNPFEFRLKRLQPCRFDLALIHAAGIEVAHLVPVRARSGVLVLRRLLQNTVQHILIVVVEDGERAPSRIRRRYVVVLDPPARSEMEEVIARRNRAVQIRKIESVATLVRASRESATTCKRRRK